MTKASSFPLYKVQRPMFGSNSWLFYTERHKNDGFQVAEGQVPKRVKQAVGKDAKAYLYLCVTNETECGCEDLSKCSHSPVYQIEYISRESSNKKTNW